jgi:5-formyltetrahydrofolate cyclo-ligase
LQTKMGLRKNILSRANRMREWSALSGLNARINARLIQHLKTRGGVWGAFVALPSEPDLSLCYEILKNQIQFVFPKVMGHEIDFYLSNQDFEKTQMGIQEPRSHEKVFASQLDGLLIPGVAFDLQANRLGRGRGFYDRFLKRSHAEKIGVCFGFQTLRENLEVESHDEKMDALMTDKFCLKFTSSRKHFDSSRFSERNFL